MRRRPVDTHMRRVDEMEQVVRKKGRGKPKKTLGETLKFDMQCMGLNEDMTKDRNTWKSRIHVANPTSGIKAGYVVVLYS